MYAARKPWSQLGQDSKRCFTLQSNHRITLSIKRRIQMETNQLSNQKNENRERKRRQCIKNHFSIIYNRPYEVGF